MNQLQQPPRQNWGTRLGVILAVMGSAVGLGNFLRFPGLAAQYEGGAFMIPYFIALLLLGLPIAWVEWTMGRYGGARGHNSPPGIFRAIWKSPVAPYVGALSALVPVIIYMYYIHLEAWCLGYAWKYLTGDMAAQMAAARGGDNPPAVSVLMDFTGMAEDGHLFTKPWSTALLFLIISFVLNFVLIYRGVNKGIEWFAKIAMPALAVCALIILVRVLTLGAPLEDQPERNVINGLGFMWNPNWAALKDTNLWVDATGQIFFSLSVGFGLIVTYASYVKKRDDIALSATTSASGNELCEVALAGMMIIPAAFIFVGPEALKATEGSGLRIGFMALPGVFDKMPAGWFFGFLFFFLLFIAAVTSSLSMLQPTIAMLEEGLGLGRKASVALLGFITAIGAGFIAYFSQDPGPLSTFDFWIGSFALYVLATIMVLIFGWAMGIGKGYEELMRGAEIRIPRAVMYLIKYVSPVYLIVRLVLWFYQQALVTEQGKTNKVQALFTDGRVQMAVGFILLVGLLFMMLVNRSVARWKRIEQQQTEVSV